MKQCPRCGKGMTTYFANVDWDYCKNCGITTRKDISVSSSLLVIYKFPSSTRQWNDTAFATNKLRREAEGDK